MLLARYLVVFSLLTLTFQGTGVCQENPFFNFESPLSHGMALSASGNTLVAVNTPNRQLCVYSLEDARKPQWQRNIPVGVEPVAVAVKNESEAWVVNHVSDSVSVVDLEHGVVVNTIPVGDRPGDIVFAAANALAFVSSMNQRCVFVIDTESQEVLKTIPIRGNDPRTLAVSNDGKTVWVAISLSGNGTTVVPMDRAPPPPKPTNPNLPPAPPQGIIVESEIAFAENLIDFELADNDVFEIDVESMEVQQAFQKVGTVLFNMAQNPRTDELWVTNTEALNEVRFEPALKGHFVENQITRLSPHDVDSKSITNLNSLPREQATARELAISTAIAQPTDVVFESAGEFAYVTSFGTDRIAKLDAQGSLVARIELSDEAAYETEPRTKRGPRCILLSEDDAVLYVLNRLSNSISVIDLETETIADEIFMIDPTPDFIREGRGYLYDAKLSAWGTASCASCHIDGDRDGLAWDLGDPAGELFSNGSSAKLHPMKGPLLTQTLKGLAGERIFHWRADRPGLESFNDTFATLLGGEPLDDDDLETFVQYLKGIQFGPNSAANFNKDFNAELVGTAAAAGKAIFETTPDIGREGRNTFRCIDCHTKPSGAGSSGFTGTIGQSTKVAQLRGLAERSVNAWGTRVNGFGFGPDGSKASPVEFLADTHRFQNISKSDRQALQSFLLAFPTETPSIVGRSCTVQANDVAVQTQLADFVSAAEQGSCHLVAHGNLGDEPVSLQYDPEQQRFHGPSSKPDGVTLQTLLRHIEKNATAISFYCLPKKFRH